MRKSSFFHRRKLLGRALVATMTSCNLGSAPAMALIKAHDSPGRRTRLKLPGHGTYLLLGTTTSQAHQVLPAPRAILGEAARGPQCQLPLNVGGQGLSTGDLSCGLRPPALEHRESRSPHTITLIFGPHWVFLSDCLLHLLSLPILTLARSGFLIVQKRTSCLGIWFSSLLLTVTSSLSLAISPRTHLSDQGPSQIPSPNSLQ